METCKVGDYVTATYCPGSVGRVVNSINDGTLCIDWFIPWHGISSYPDLEFPEYREYFRLLSDAEVTLLLLTSDR